MVNRIERPEWFTLEKYEEYKAKGFTQVQIANELFVHYQTLKRFLKEIGAKPGGLKPKQERPAWLTKDTYKKMRKAGYSNRKIMDLCHTNKIAFNRFLAEIGVKK